MENRIQQINENMEAEIDSILENLKCPLCLDFFDDPIMEFPNQHIFCNKCLNKYINHQKFEGVSIICPICKIAITSFETPRLVVNLLSHIKVKCRENIINSGNDLFMPKCDWLGNMNEFWIHIKKCPIIIQKNGEKLKQICENMKIVLDKEINPHLKSEHEEIFKTYVKDWEWLLSDKRDWKWWWWAKNEWWGNKPCLECNRVWQLYDKELQSLEIRRVDLINEHIPDI